MATVSVKKRINAPVDRVFKTWHEEYAEMYKFNPNLLHSFVIDGSPSTYGKGALRQCNLKDGKSWLKEKVVSYKDRKQVVVDIYETNMPIKACSAVTDLKVISPDQTEVIFTMNFTPKMGFIGKLMEPMMKNKFRPMMEAVLDGNANYIESGKQVNPTYTLVN